MIGTCVCLVPKPSSLDSPAAQPGLEKRLASFSLQHFFRLIFSETTGSPSGFSDLPLPVFLELSLLPQVSFMSFWVGSHPV